MKRLLLAAALFAACSSTQAKLGSIKVTAPAGATAGQPITVALQAFDTGNAAFDFEGPVEIDDAGAAVGSVTFAAADHGVQNTQVTLKTAGDHALTAVSGSVQAQFHVNVIAGAAAAAQLAAGDAQQGTVGTALAAPLAIKVTDAFGNPVSGESVAWKVVSGGGTVASPGSSTGADGVATVAVTLDKVAGPEQFQGSWGSVVVGFTATAKAGAASRLVVVGGNDQRATAGSALAQPFKVRATDPFGNIIPSPSVTWKANLAGDAVSAQPPDAEGNAVAAGTLGSGTGPRSFTATLSGSVTATFDATTYQLSYAAPTAGGKVRLVANVASTPEVAVLDLVANTALTAFSAGMNLPLDGSKVVADATPLVPGTALPAGTAPVAARAALLGAGPLKGVLVSVQTQKAAGSGAVPNDTAIASGAVLYTLRIHLKGSAAAGTVFDGAALATNFRAAVRNKAGTDVASSADFFLGKLTVGP